MNKPRAIAVLLLWICATPWAAAAALERAANATPATTATTTAADQPVHISPYTLAARRHALTTVNEPLLVIPPSQRHTRLVSGQPQH